VRGAGGGSSTRYTLLADSKVFKLVKFALSQLAFGIPELAVEAAAFAADQASKKPITRAKPLAFLDDAVGSILRDKS